MDISYTTIVGILALVCGFGAVSQRSDFKLRLFSAIAAFAWAYHFWLLDASTPCLMSILIGIRQLLATWLLNKSKKQKLIFFILFETIFIMSTFYTWSGLTSLVPLVATGLATFGFFYLTGYRLRKLMYIVGATWLINDLIVLSWPHALSTIIQLSINFYVAQKLKKEEQSKLILVSEIAV